MPENFDLDIEHPHYKRNEVLRHDSRILYEGRHAEILAADFLIKGTYEERHFYDQRKKRLVYENLLRPIVSARVGLLTRKPIQISVPQNIEEFMDDVDGQGTAIQPWIKDMITDADVDGIVWALVDVPNTFNLRDEQGRPLIQSKQDEEEAGIRPFVRKIPASDVIRWKQNKFDYKLDWVVMRMHFKSEEIVGVPSKPEERWVVWTRNTISIYGRNQQSSAREKYVLLNETPNTIGEVPLVPYYGIRDKFNFTGLPFGYLILDHLKRILNVESMLDHSLELVTMPRMFIMALDQPTEMPTANNAFFLPIGEDGQKPDVKFIEPSGKGIELAHQRIADLIARVFRNTLFLNKKPTAQVQSAESQKEETTVLKADLSSAALNHETSTNEVLRLMYRWETSGQEPEEGTISTQFTRDFDVRKLSPQELKELRAMVDSDTPTLSTQTLWELLQKGEILADSFDPEEEAQKLLEEADVREKNTDIDSL